jgi:hypothetical protein
MFRFWRPIITNAKQHNCFIYKALRWRARQVTLNPFAASFHLILLKAEMPLWYSLVSESIVAGLMFLIAHYVYEYGLDRQIRNNDFFLALFLKHRQEVIRQLRSKNPTKKVQHEN